MYKFISLFLLIIIFQGFLFSQNSIEENALENILLLKNSKTGKLKTIPSEEKVKIWLIDEIQKTGIFKKVESGIIFLETESGLESCPIAETIQIRRFGSGGAQFIGAGLIGFGAVCLFFAGVTLAVGVAAILLDNLSALILVATPFLGGLGLLSYSAGQKLFGKKYNLQKNWQITNI